MRSRGKLMRAVLQRSRRRSSWSSRRRRCAAWATRAASRCRSRIAPGRTRRSSSRRVTRQFDGRSAQAAGAGRALFHLPRQLPAALRQRRPRKGETAERRRDGCLPGAPGLPGRAVYQRFQLPRPHLARDGAGGCSLPRERRAAVARLQTRNLARADGAARRGHGPEGHHRARTASSATTSTVPRRSTATRRPATAADRRSRRCRKWPARCCRRQYSFEWTDLAYQEEAGRQHRALHLPALHPLRLAHAFRGVRELRALDGDHPHRADVPALRHRRRLAAAHGQQHLHADRLRGAGGHEREERGAHRRVRQAAAGA